MTRLNFQYNWKYVNSNYIKAIFIIFVIKFNVLVQLALSNTFIFIIMVSIKSTSIEYLQPKIKENHKLFKLTFDELF